MIVWDILLVTSNFWLKDFLKSVSPHDPYFFLSFSSNFIVLVWTPTVLRDCEFHSLLCVKK